jgi:hypothetical protein
MPWHGWHFDAVDDNSHERDFKAVWRIEAKAFTPAASAGPGSPPPRPSRQPGGAASNGSEGWKWMSTGTPPASDGDITEHRRERIRTNARGWAEFRCPPASLTVRVESNA